MHLSKIPGPPAFAAGRVGVGSGDGRMLTHVQTRDCLNKRRTGVEIRVRCAAIARPKTGVYSELRKVCEPFKILVRPCRRTARQSSKPAEVYGLGAFRLQVRFEKSCVTNLIIGIVVDVLRHVAIKNRERGGICWISAAHA